MLANSLSLPTDCHCLIAATQSVDCAHPQAKLCALTVHFLSHSKFSFTQDFQAISTPLTVLAGATHFSANCQ